MTHVTRIDDYRIPSQDEAIADVASVDPERAGVGLRDRLSEAALAEALRHAAPKGDVDPSVIDQTRLEFGEAALQSAAMPNAVTAAPEVLTIPTDPATLYRFSYYIADFRRRALDPPQDMAA